MLAAQHRQSWDSSIEVLHVAYLPSDGTQESRETLLDAAAATADRGSSLRQQLAVQAHKVHDTLPTSGTTAGGLVSSADKRQ
jgi:hypothetical protein